MRNISPLPPSVFLYFIRDWIAVNLPYHTQRQDTALNDHPICFLNNQNPCPKKDSRYEHQAM